MSLLVASIFILSAESLGSPVHNPILTISNNSLEAINIANKISQHFQNVNYGDAVKKVELFPVQNSHTESSELDQSVLRLSMNFNVKINNGRPQRLTFPQGDLIVMFLPDQSRVTEQQIQEFMAATTGTTNTAKAQNGLLLTSWEEKEAKGPTARSDSISTLASNDIELSTLQKRKSNEEVAVTKDKQQPSIEKMHEKITKDGEVRRKWNQGAIPTFPNYHGYDTSEAFESTYEMKEKILEEKKSQLAELIQNLRKNYRQDEPELDMSPHFNFNNVVAGERNRPIGHMTSSVECSEINGETKCKRKSSSCSSSFGQDCDTKNDPIMGHTAQQNRIVPFSQPQGPMSMRGSLVTDVKRRRTTTTITTTSTTTTTTLATTSPPQRQLNEMIVEHVMGMDAHSLADALHDPMMMAIGSMVVMAGAYMAIVMQEQAAANAFALAAAAGKK